MNKYQKNFLMLCAVTFVVAAAKVFAGPGLLPTKLEMIAIYWSAMGVVFGICVKKLRLPTQPERQRPPQRDAREIPPKL